MGDKSISEAISTPSFGDGRGVSVKKKIETCPNLRKPLFFFLNETKRLKLLPTVAEALAKC